MIRTLEPFARYERREAILASKLQYSKAMGCYNYTTCKTNQRQLVGMVNREVERHMLVSLNMTVGFSPSLEHDPLLGHEVTQAKDIRIFRISPKHWI